MSGRCEVVDVAIRRKGWDSVLYCCCQLRDEDVVLGRASETSKDPCERPPYDHSEDKAADCNRNSSGPSMCRGKIGSKRIEDLWSYCADTLDKRQCFEPSEVWCERLT